MLNIDRLEPAPQGFGRCRTCPYLQVGSAAICYACASKGMVQLSDDRCMVCDQPLPPSGTCSNFWCGRNDRYFECIYAISMHTGQLKEAIAAYKYRNVKAWAAIFGRVLVGYLDENPQWFSDVDVIVPSPTFVGGRRSWDHIGEIVRQAELEADGRWPFDTSGVITKVADTDSLVGKTWTERREIALNQIRPALRIPYQGRISAKSILVVDDVFTDGSTLVEVARALRLSGAVTVSQVVLARQPWRQQ